MKLNEIVKTKFLPPLCRSTYHSLKFVVEESCGKFVTKLLARDCTRSWYHPKKYDRSYKSGLYLSDDIRLFETAEEARSGAWQHFDRNRSYYIPESQNS